MDSRVRGVILASTLFIAALSVGLTVAARPLESGNNSSVIAYTGYVLKDFEGKLAIFENGTETPLEILDVTVESLPERDITRIKAGMHAATLEDAISMAEDYE